MKTTTKLLGIALVTILVASGLGAAAGGFGAGPIAGDGLRTPLGGGGVGPVGVADRPLDGHNSPWVTGDERLDRFQARYDLTDTQMEQIRTEVAAMIDDGADRQAVQAKVETMLADFGVETPALGPRYDGRLGDGPRGAGLYGPADGVARHGGFGGHGGIGPNGVMDGSCMG
ncbi:MAG: hypothetical protein ABEJ28_04040 [Salinigranum sp.]